MHGQPHIRFVTHNPQSGTANSLKHPIYTKKAGNNDYMSMTCTAANGSYTAVTRKSRAVILFYIPAPYTNTDITLL